MSSSLQLSAVSLCKMLCSGKDTILASVSHDQNNDWKKVVLTILQEAKDSNIRVRPSNHQEKDPDRDTVVRCRIKYLRSLWWEELSLVQSK